MKKSTSSYKISSMLLGAFVIWTLCIQTIDVKPVGIQGTAVGFASLNQWFHQLTGVHMTLYTITDWMGLVPVAICLGFALLGLMQWIRRHHLWQVDFDILVLGVYYILVMIGYLIFEMIPINYRPILIEGRMEASYPSSTTLLVVSVMPTLVFQIKRRWQNRMAACIATELAAGFTAFMVMGRLLAGVHWVTDIIGALLLSGGMFYLYKAVVFGHDKTRI